MNKPEFKILPCVFCTIGFNCYVAGHKVISSTYQRITDKRSNQQYLVDQNQTEQVKLFKK